MYHSISSQLPSYVVSNYPTFVLFMQTYFEWLQKEGSPYGDLRSHIPKFNLDESLDAYENALKKEYFPNLPDTVKINRSLLIRHSKDFFRTVGTEAAFRFIFEIVYGEKIEFYYPRDFMLIPSNGKWADDEVRMLTTNKSKTSFDFKVISQVRTDGVEVFGKVSSVSTSTAQGFVYANLRLTESTNSFELGVPIKVDGVFEEIIPSYSTPIINSPGMGYNVGDILTYTGPTTFTYTTVASSAGVVATKYPTTFFPSQLTVKRNGTVLSGVVYDGINVIHPSIAPGNTIEITYPVVPGLFSVSKIGVFGNIEKVKELDAPIGIPANSVYVGSQGGSGGSITVNLGSTSAVDGGYVNTDGFLSDKDVLQDSDKFQDFSYVIKSSLPQSVYKPIVYSTTHPAGFKLASEVMFLDVFDLSQSLMLFEINSTNEMNIKSDISSAGNLFSNYGMVDDLKHFLGAGHYKVENFLDMVAGSVINTPHEHHNITDTKVDYKNGGNPTVYEKDLDE